MIIIEKKVLPRQRSEDLVRSRFALTGHARAESILA